MKKIYTSLCILLSSAAIAAPHNDDDPSPYFANTPIDLLAFEGRGIAEGVMLFWETSTEWQADSYVVQRSADGLSWEDAGTLEAGGNSVAQRQYTYVDQTPYAGVNFYRLIQRDYLGEERVTDYIDIDYDGRFDSALFPNPIATEQQINLRFYGFENQELQTELVDMSGRRLGRQTFDLTEGENLLPLENRARRPGMYFVQVYADDYPVTSYRLIVRE